MLNTSQGFNVCTCKGLAVPVIGVNSFATALPLVDKVVPVG
jgi:hypothetical protein